jgi:hypothetical protein
MTELAFFDNLSLEELNSKIIQLKPGDIKDKTNEKKLTFLRLFVYRLERNAKLSTEVNEIARSKLFDDIEQNESRIAILSSDKAIVDWVF